MYSDYFYINKNFQSSINLELDLNNEAKIYEYIPTTDICDVLKRYIKTIVGNSKEKATTLVGPYGKGKSFLLLILNYLIGNNKDSRCWIDLVNKIKLVDNELFELLMKMKEQEISLLTVIINSNYDNIKQSFQIALSESLKREKINDIVPNSVFNVCLDLIAKWEQDEKIKREVLKKCLELHKIKIKTLINDLNNCSYKAYEQFKELYNCVNIGLEFNPLVNNDVVKIYKDVAEDISTKGYSGIFIVFDEFSKFLESNSLDLMVDLKLIQDFAEAANSSNIKSQINLCCVTHKNVSLYLGRNKKDTIVDSFKTVEGRFQEIKFNRSLEENYQLISNAIYKKDYANEISNNYLLKHKEFYNRIVETNLFDINDIEQLLFNGCFPLNPMTVYALIHLSEIVAQNERTLFTFLSDSNENSLNTFIHNNNQGLFNVDKIYDYFNDLFQKEEANYIRNIWYRAESILAKLDSIAEKKIIKAIAIILMINDYDKLPCNEETIALSLSMSNDEIARLINKLIENHYIRRNLLNNLLSFALFNSKHIDEAIEVLSKTKFKDLKYNEVFEKINDKKYVIPRRCNEENKITRFYTVIFIGELEFNNLFNFDLYFENRYCDGIVINLLNEKLTETDITKKIREINNPRVILRCPNMDIDENLYHLAMRYACLEEIKYKKDIDELSSEEINLLLDETQTDILVLLEKYYSTDSKVYNSLIDNEAFNETLSLIMDNIYSYKLIFNNELINKKTVTAQYQKAINHVIDYLINNEEDFGYSETSPESSIKYSVLDYNEENQNFRDVIESIKKKIINSEIKKVPVYDIMAYYSQPPYGIRDGVLPLLLAKAISELSDNIILYLQSKEIELNSSNLVKAVLNNKYYLSFAKGSKEQSKYLSSMLELFDLNEQENFRKSVIALAERVKKYFVGLPKIIRSCNVKNNILNLDEQFIKYKSFFLSFNINPFEVIFEEPQKIYCTKKYSDLFLMIKQSILQVNKKLLDYKASLVEGIKELYNIDFNSSLKKGLSEWIKDNIILDKSIILSDDNRRIYECLLNKLDYDDINSVDLICKAVIGTFIEDWDLDRSENLYENLKRFVDNVKNAEYVNENTQNLIEYLDTNFDDISPMASVLKDNILSILEEYSDSVDNTEKITVLKDLIKRLL